MIRAVDGVRPSLQLPPEVFAAIIALEHYAHTVGATRPGPEGEGPCGLPCRTDDESGLAHVQAVVNAGGARDRLARVILELITPEN